jgi:hypothetical protein
MEIGETELKAALGYYLNSDVFFSKHKVIVTYISRKSSGRTVIHLKGQDEPQRVVELVPTDDGTAHAVSGGD